ncbi:diacylglycerol/lipid kinase family protein [Nonomuraea africana]|uniref:Diacylglycerol kinase family enzyme n=1 Tax=Nonomuraea africana TaxID=46171 RepID=A0ABR9KBT1_9ACTN|nr:diacylglycerol kinase family protein [Nonomuraea africana]MBE1559475.1 diacylglycerol kinase family enzyme [Nonomuraea africana]
MKLLVIHNSSAGGADDESVRTVLRTLEAGADVLTCEDPDDLGGALAAHPDRVPVVMGGDGSLHALVAALAARGELAGRPVGLIPLGTGNDLARGLGIPLDPREAARVVLDGHTRALDLLTDDRGGIVVNAVHVGVGAQASERATALKPVLRRAAYAVGAMLAGLRARGWRLRISVDGTPVADGRRRVLMAGIGNGTSIGGGTPLTPAALPDDGLADVVVSFAVSPPARLGFALLLRRGEHRSRGDVRTYRGGEITIAGEAVPVNADGELGPPTARRTWTVQRQAWRILAPAASVGRTG